MATRATLAPLLALILFLLPLLVEGLDFECLLAVSRAIEGGFAPPSVASQQECLDASSSDQAMKYCLSPKSLSETMELCLPEQCTRDDLREIYRFAEEACEPSTSCIEMDASARLPCMVMQQNRTMCGKVANSTASIADENIHLSCFHSSTSNETKAQLLADTLECAPMGQPPGAVNDLANWDACHELKTAHYCVVDYKNIFVTAGQCVAPTCDGSKYASMARMACEVDDCMGMAAMMPVGHCLFWRALLCPPEGTPNYNVTVEATCSPTDAPAMSAGFYVMIGISSALVLLIAAASAMAVWRQKEANGGRREPSIAERALTAFYLPDNWRGLWSTKQGDGEVSCLHGIRVVSIVWILLAHLFILYQAMPAINYPDLVEAMGKVSFQVVTGAFFAVDTFFLLSGFLLVFVTLKHVARTGNSRINVPLAVLHRWIRMSVVYAFFIGVWEFVAPHVSNGPLWPIFTGPLHRTFNPILVPAAEGSPSACQQYWWANLLYINNFVPSERPLAFGCMPWTWYLANDFQFFVIGILLMAIYCGYSKRIARVVMGTMLVACWVVTGTRNILKGWQVGFFALLEDDEFYIKPWTRIAPYLLGMMGALLVSEHQEQLRRWLLRLRRFGRVGLHVLLASAMLFLIFVQYSAHKIPSTPWTPVQTFFYNTFSRSVWGLGVLWVVFCCATGMTPNVNRLLSLSLYRPFARLTYTLYLVHLPVIAALLYSAKNLIFLTYANTVVSFPAVIVLGFAVACVLYLLVEAPSLHLNKLIMDNTYMRKASLKGKEEQQRGDETMDEESCHPPTASKEATEASVSSQSPYDSVDLMEVRV